MEKSGAEEWMGLGDQPRKWFLASYDGSIQRLADFGGTADRFGLAAELRIGGRIWQARAWAHPRQAERLDKSHDA